MTTKVPETMLKLGTIPSLMDLTSAQTVTARKTFAGGIGVLNVGQFDVSNSALSTEGLRLRGLATGAPYIIQGVATYQLTDMNLGKPGWILDTTNLVILPPLTGKSGAVVMLKNLSTINCTVQASGGDIRNSLSAASSFRLPPIGDVWLMTDGYSWVLHGLDQSPPGSALTIGSSHVQIFPPYNVVTGACKMIITGESNLLGAPTTVIVNFPRAFLSAPTVIAGIRNTGLTAIESFGSVVGTPTTTQVLLRAELGTGFTSFNGFITYFAMGDHIP